MGEIMAYSKGIREQAMVLCQNGLSDDKVCTKLGMSKQTLSNWKKKLFTTGSLDKKKVNRTSGKPYKYSADKIGVLLAKSKTADAAVSNETPFMKANKNKKKKLKF